MSYEIKKFESVRGAIHDLAHLETLSDARCNLLLVSDRTLYILLNLAALDAGFAGRYAIEKFTEGFIAVGPGDGEHWNTFQETYNNLKLELLDMTCDIENGLTAIADAIAGLTINCGGGGWGPSDGGSQLLPCIGDLDNNQLLGPGESEAGDPDIDPPPDGFDTWEEYFDYKCKAAAYLWQMGRTLITANMALSGLQLVSAIVAPVVAGALGALPAAFTPAGFIIFVGSIVAIGVLSSVALAELSQMMDWWDENKSDIVCSLYNSGTSADAISAVSNAVEDGVQAIVWGGALEPLGGALSGLLGEAFSQLENNGFVEPLFKSVIAVAEFEADCSDCGQQEGYMYVDEYVELIVDTEEVDITVTNPHALEGPPDGWGATFDYAFVSGNGYSAVDVVVDLGDVVETDEYGIFQVRSRAPINREHNIFQDYIHGTNQWWAVSVDGEEWSAFTMETWDAGTQAAYTWGPEVELGAQVFRYLKLRFLPAWFAEPISQDGGIDCILVGPIIE